MNSHQLIDFSDVLFIVQFSGTGSFLFFNLHVGTVGPAGFTFFSLTSCVVVLHGTGRTVSLPSSEARIISPGCHRSIGRIYFWGVTSEVDNKDMIP